MGASNKVRVLTGKHGNKNFYKGTGSGRMGRHVFKGKSGSTYKVEEWQTRKFIAPQGEDSGLLKPYVSSEVPFWDEFRQVHGFQSYFKPETWPEQLGGLNTTQSQMNNNLHKNGINIETPNFSSSGDSSSSNTYQSTEEKKAEDDRKIARLEQQMERIAELRDELIAKRVQAVKEAAEEAASKGPSSSSSSSSSTSLSNTEEDYLDRQYKEKHTKLNQLVERRERALLDESLLRRCHKAAARALTVISAPTPRQITDVERQSGYMQHYLKGWIKERKKQRQQQREQMEEEEVEEEEEVSEEDGVRLGEMQPLQRRPFVEADVIDASATTISKS